MQNTGFLSSGLEAGVDADGCESQSGSWLAAG